MKKNCKNNSSISFNSNQNQNNTPNTDNMFDFDNPDLTNINVPGRNEKVLEDFYRTYRQFMYAVARSAGYDYHTASLAINDVLIRLSTRGCDFNPARGKFRAYLAQIVRNTCSNVKREWQKEFAFEPEDIVLLSDKKCSTASPDMFLQQEEHKQIMLEVEKHLWKTKLDPKAIHAFVRVALNGERPQDVAKALGMKPSEVHQAKFRIMTTYVRPFIRRLDNAC